MSRGLASGWGLSSEQWKFFPETLNNSERGGVEACVTKNYQTMKKLIATIAVSAFAFFGTAVESDARPHRGGYGHQAPQSQVYVSGYRHGRPIYTQKTFVGYRHGRPVYSYRTISAPRRHHNHCDTGYRRGGYDRGGYSNYGGRRSSGSSVSFTWSR